MSKKLAKALNSALTSLTTGLQSSDKTNQNLQSKRRRFRRIYRPRRQFQRTLPASYIASLRPRYSIVSKGINSVRVSGVDLVYAMPDVIQANNVGIFTLIPANPAYWTGTKIAKLAGAYMNYRPIQMRFSYVPQVAVTQQGTVYMGTFWNGASALPNIQQSLVSSNGGTTTPCYSPKDTSIALGTNLPQNLFTMCGPLGPNTLPFIFIAGVAGADVVPGYFYVTYTFEFKNPVGDAWRYTRTEVMDVSDMPPYSTHENASAVLLSSSGRFGPGTIFDFETSGLYYHGSKVKLDPTSSIILFYSDQSESSFIESKAPKITYFRTNLDSAVHMLSDMTLIKEGGTRPNFGITILPALANGLTPITYGNLGAVSTVASTDQWVYALTDVPAAMQFFDQDGKMVYQDLSDSTGTLDISSDWINLHLLPGYPPSDPPVLRSRMVAPSPILSRPYASSSSSSTDSEVLGFETAPISE